MKRVIIANINSDTMSAKDVANMNYLQDYCDLGFKRIRIDGMKKYGIELNLNH